MVFQLTQHRDMDPSLKVFAAPFPFPFGLSLTSFSKDRHWTCVLPVSRGRGGMTRAHWLLLGAVGLGLAIVIYFVFLCPTNCE